MEHQDNNFSRDPWDSDSYETGSTRPPKTHRGMWAVMLISGIVIGGLLALLGGINSGVLSRWNQEDPQPTLPVSLEVSDQDPSVPSVPQETVRRPDAGSEISVNITPAPQASEDGMQTLSFQQIYKKNIPSVVSVVCRLPGGSSTGTGVVLTADGYIITNAHVVKNAVAVEALFTDGRTLPAELVGEDTLSDLAVLYVEADDLIPAEFGSSEHLQVGDPVAAIGDPLGVELRGTMTDGIVSAINRNITTGGRTMTLIQTNAALNSGNSGGPLINIFGQVVGINTMKIGDRVSGAGVEGLGFAIPSTTVKDVVDQLIAQGYVSGRPTLGITGTTVSEFYQYYYRLPGGLYVSDIDQQSDAYQQGLRVKDIILTVNGQRIYSEEDLKKVLYSAQVGDRVQVQFYRNGQQYELTAALEEWVQ